MVSIHRKKSFKATVSFVSTNVFQKVVTIRNSCSTSPSPDTRRTIPTEMGVAHREIIEDFCCSISVPMNIIVDKQDEVSEVSLDVYLVVPEDRPPTPRPIRKSWRNFCMPKPRTTCGLRRDVDSMEWPSDEEDFEEEEEDTNTLWEPRNQTCGFDFWAPKQRTTSEVWGLSIANRDDDDEKAGRLSSSSREHGLTSSGSPYDTKEPIGIFRQSIFTFQGMI